MMTPQFLLFLFLTHLIYSQTNALTQLQIDSIQSNRVAQEGDLYLNLSDGQYFIGQTNGSLSPLILNLISIEGNGPYILKNGFGDEFSIDLSGNATHTPIVASTETVECVSQLKVGDELNFFINGEFFLSNSVVTVPGHQLLDYQIINENRISAKLKIGQYPDSASVQVSSNGKVGQLTEGLILRAPQEYILAASDIATIGNVTVSIDQNGFTHVQKSSGSGWNAFAHASTHKIPVGQEGYLIFEVDRPITNRRPNDKIGLYSTPSESNTIFNYSLFFQYQTRLIVNDTEFHQSGSTTHKSAYINYTDQDVFKINIDCNGQVTYLVLNKGNNTFELIHTSPVLVSTDLYFDTAFFYPYLGFRNIKIAY